MVIISWLRVDPSLDAPIPTGRPIISRASFIIASRAVASASGNSRAAGGGESSDINSQGPAVAPPIDF